MSVNEDRTVLVDCRQTGFALSEHFGLIFIDGETFLVIPLLSCGHYVTILTPWARKRRRYHTPGDPQNQVCIHSALNQNSTWVDKFQYANDGLILCQTSLPQGNLVFAVRKLVGRPACSSQQQCWRRLARNTTFASIQPVLIWRLEHSAVGASEPASKRASHNPQSLDHLSIELRVQDLQPLGD